jgi:Tat protein secretion system quality control protein TatD with DNase activity
VEYKGEESRPTHIVKTLHELIDLKGFSPEKTTKVTTESAIDFFGLSNLTGK